jgi:hypothetical protein
MKIYHELCAVLCAALILVPAAACSKGAQRSVQTGTVAGSGGRASGTQIVGKVTSVVGNQVTLALGTLNGAGSFAGRRQSGKTSSGESRAVSAAPSSGTLSGTVSAASAESGGSSSSGLITLSGKSETVLIPVGLTLTSGTSRGGAGGSGSGAREGAASSGSAGGGVAGRSGRTQNASAAAATVQKARDFSSITKGMILQITERTLSDGTQGIVRVAVLSE